VTGAGESFDDSLLDDPGRLIAADPAGALRAAAMAGAQIRSMAESAADAGVTGALAPRRGSGRPRALVVLRPAGVARQAVGLVTALLGAGCPVPVVVADELPSWVGSLDIVVGHTDDAGDYALAGAVDLAARRGAQVVVTAPLDGPVAAAAAGRALLIRPRVPVPPSLSLPGAVATVLTVVTALGFLHTDLGRLADELDAEAARAHPGVEPFVNPAKQLALRLADRVPVLLGADRVAAQVAGIGVTTLAAHAGVIGYGGPLERLGDRPALLASVLAEAGQHDVFHDPFEDDGGAGQQLRLVRLVVAPDDGAGDPAGPGGRAGPGGPAGPGGLGGAPAGRPPQWFAEPWLGPVIGRADTLSAPDEAGDDEVVRAMVLVVRLDLAAVYLGLGRGTLPADRMLPVAAEPAGPRDPGGSTGGPAGSLEPSWISDDTGRSWPEGGGVATRTPI
jgi:hypothetical protein